MGLGNIWRFPSVLGQNGGGAYLIPYLLAAFVFAVPLLILELSVGRDLRMDVVSAFSSVRKRYTALGWMVVGSALLILSYYLVLTGWVLAFLIRFLTGSGTSFAEFTSSYYPLVYFLVATLITGSIVSQGVRSGIEKMSKIVMPTVFGILVVLGIYSTTLPGFGEAVGFLFTPDFSVLRDPLIWSAAFGQVFFSLSVGQGIMMTYGSYVGSETDILRSSLIITVADILVALVSGVVIFPVVFSFGLEPGLGTQLAFSTLPRAFSSMPFGRVIGTAFFGLLFFAALSSSVSLLEVGISAVMGTRVPGTRISRGHATWLLTVFVFTIGLPSALSYTGMGLRLLEVPILDLMDETVGTLGLPITAVVIIFVFVWSQTPSRVESQIRHPELVPLLKYVIAGVLVVITLTRLLVSFDFPGWHILPGFVPIGSVRQTALTVGLIVAIYLGAHIVIRKYPRRRR